MAVGSARRGLIAVAIGGVLAAEGLLLAGFHPGDIAVGANDLDGRMHIAGHLDGVALVAEVDHHMLSGIERSGFAEVVGKRQDAVVGSRANHEAVGMSRVSMELQGAAVEDNGAHELAGFEIFQGLPFGLTFVVLLHVVRIGVRCERVERL
jgi:hypothetical protein